MVGEIPIPGIYLDLFGDRFALAGGVLYLAIFWWQNGRCSKISEGSRTRKCQNASLKDVLRDLLQDMWQWLTQCVGMDIYYLTNCFPQIMSLIMNMWRLKRNYWISSYTIKYVEIYDLLVLR